MRYKGPVAVIAVTDLPQEGSGYVCERRFGIAADEGSETMGKDGGMQAGVFKKRIRSAAESESRHFFCSKL